MPHEEHDLLGIGKAQRGEEAESQGDEAADRRASHVGPLLS